MNERPTLFLIDGSSYFYRAFHAIRGLSRSSDGMPTNAIYGFVRMLMKVIREGKPTHVAIAWDARGPTFRHDIFSDYKANRPEMPEELQVQIPYIRKIVESLCIPSLELPGWEADDIIGTMTRKAEQENMDVVIVSGDKDLMQLVGPHVIMWDTMPQKDIRYDAEGVKRRFGVPPHQVTEVMALAGDKSDNISGVPGIGEKKAGDLIQKFGSVENLLAHLHDLKGKMRENLEAHAEDALLSKRLVRIDTEAPLELGPKELKQGEADLQGLDAVFRELEFTQLRRELTQKKEISYDAYRLANNESAFDALTGRLRAVAEFALDTETTSLDPMKAELVGISVACGIGEAYYVPVGHRYDGVSKQLSLETLKKKLGPILADESIAKIGQNIKYDLIVLHRHGFELKGIECDTMIASYVLDPSRRSHGLEDLSMDLLGHRMTAYKDVVGTGQKAVSFSSVDVTTAMKYSCEDADATLRLAGILLPQLDQAGLRKLFAEVEMPLLEVLAEMEMRGVRVDKMRLRELSLDMENRMSSLEERIYELAGERFLINSHQQLGRILFVKLNLPAVKKTQKKTGYSTDVEVLEQLSPQHPLPGAVLEYRSLAKLKSTYVDALLEMIHPETGRIHTSYNQTVAATGRLSSSNPNLQNIPIRTEEGRHIRQVFIPQEGWVMLSADYSQIELRLLAHLSEDETLCRAFYEGEDIHARTAADVFGVDLQEVSAELRHRAKAVNFGIIYGQKGFGLSRELGISTREAQDIIDRYFDRYPGVRRYREKVILQAQEHGFVTTLLGRRRMVPEILSPNRVAREAAERVATNTPLQGTAADLIKLVMIRIAPRIRKEGWKSRMLLQVHDELVFESPPEEIDALEAAVREDMENVMPLKVPLVVDVHRGRNWDEAH
ncbi:MAG: DNA polymerase I [Deltaproteobacteria bacterium]|nr:DNA polymerase I [Deltaproteobacteria bacterium]